MRAVNRGVAPPPSARVAPPAAREAAAASHSELPSARARSRSASRLFAPTPRGGRLTTRSKEASSRRVAGGLGYAGAALVSGRPENRSPPENPDGARADRKASPQTP